MKLFAKYNRINITATVFAFILGSIAFYFVLHYVLIRQLNETLRAEQQEITAFVEAHHQLPEIQNTKHQWITIEKTVTPLSRAKIKSIPYFNQKENETQYIRQLVFPLHMPGQDYLVKVNKSEAETEDLLKLIILVTIGMIGLILLFNYIINRKVVNRLWQPFYITIDSIKHYHVSNREPLQLSKEPVDELNLLNESLNKMTQSVFNEYTALKTFTENASHEMQTPLAVIRSKVEMLLQQPEWKEHDLQQLLSIEDAVLKLSRLHQSLLLLTKLENKQFELNEKINLRKIIEDKLNDRQELLVPKQLKVFTDCKEVTIAFHYHLAEILVNNLLNNAIFHTPAAGSIWIEMTPEFLSIKNTAVNGSLDNNKIFKRFYKADHSQEGTGLGLAIINEICNVAGFTVTYRFNINQHIFTIHF
jgi:signal transduction histidine kinase